MAEVYHRPQKIMFQHCDPAGIVFYPRYFEMLNATVEDWFDEVVGVSFADMHGPRQMAVPTAQVAADFQAPSRLGETVEFRLAVTRLGGASMTLRIEAHGADGLRLTATMTIVSVGKTSLRPEPWPSDIRARVEPMLTAEGDT